MRAVSFVDKVEFEFGGNFCKDAICLGDVDNDKDIELVAANIHGDLGIFKGQQSRPWASASDLGSVASVLVGEILNDKQNYVVSVSCEGWCNIFSIKSDATEEERKKLTPFHTQRLPANTKIALLADLDDDGKTELILALTDRVVRTYRWMFLPQSTLGSNQGKLVGLYKWEFANQIGTISLNPTLEGGTSLLVAQPGGTYTKLECNLESEGEGELPNSVLSKLTPQHHSLPSSHMRNPNVSSEIVGGIRGTRNGQPTNSLMALATLDGTLMLVDGDNILWSLQVDHQLFALTKLDLIGDNKEEVIACAWDGQTYIVNQERQSVRFQFDEAVCAFTAGHFSILPGQAVPCLVYVTFSKRIFVYYNVTFPAVRTYSLLEVMDLKEDTKVLLAELNIKGSDVRQFYNWCLYGLPAKLQALSCSSEEAPEEVEDEIEGIK